MLSVTHEWQRKGFGVWGEEPTKNFTGILLVMSEMVREYFLTCLGKSRHISYLDS